MVNNSAGTVNEIGKSKKYSEQDSGLDFLKLFPVEAGVTHFGNDAQLAAGLAEGIAGESSVLGEFAEYLGKFFWFFHRPGNFVFVN